MPEFEDRRSSIPDPNESDATEAALDPDLEFRAAFAETLAQHGFSDTLVLARGRAEDIFSDRRLEIVDHLKDESPRSVRALADSLGYEKGVVSRDIQKLAELDVIEYEENGRAKAPRLKHRHVAVEPIV